MTRVIREISLDVGEEIQCLGDDHGELDGVMLSRLICRVVNQNSNTI